MKAEVWEILGRQDHISPETLSVIHRSTWIEWLDEFYKDSITIRGILRDAVDASIFRAVSHWRKERRWLSILYKPLRNWCALSWYPQLRYNQACSQTPSLVSWPVNIKITSDIISKEKAFRQGQTALASFQPTSQFSYSALQTWVDSDRIYCAELIASTAFISFKWLL